jgi:hypothetical protein
MVKKARTTDTIEMNESNFRPGSGYERYTKTESGGGVTFVVVETHVVNNAMTDQPRLDVQPADSHPSRR